MPGLVGAQEHVPQHLLGDGDVGGVADEVGAEGVLAERAEGHVEPPDLPLRPVRLGDGVERDVRVGGLHVVGQLDVLQLGTADHPLLLLDRQRVPGGEVVQVLLHDDVAAALELRVLVADHHRGERGVALRVLGAVDEAHQVALVEVLEAVHLVGDGHGAPQPVHQPGGQLEAEVGPAGADVEQHVARGGRGGVARPAQLLEGVEPGRARPGEQAPPGVRTDPRHTGQLVRHPEAHGAAERRHVLEEVVHRLLPARVDGQHQEDGALRDRGEDGLRLGRRAGVRGRGALMRGRLPGRWRRRPGRASGRPPTLSGAALGGRPCRSPSSAARRPHAGRARPNGGPSVPRPAPVVPGQRAAALGPSSAKSPLIAAAIRR